MKDDVVIVLVLILIAVGGLLYFFRDNIRGVSDDTTPNVKQEMVDVREDIQDAAADVKDAAGDVKDNIVDGVEDVRN